MHGKPKQKGGSRRNRVRGRTTARVQSVNSIVHLDPSSALHAQHQQLSKQLHANARQEITVSVEPPTPIKFPSLQKGLLFDGKGAFIDSQEHLQLLTRCRGTDQNQPGVDGSKPATLSWLGLW